MNEKIYTIPVTEAFEKESECPFCTMREKLEQDAIGYTLGPSYMEQDVRDVTNEKGFCREHYRQMYKNKNRLGVALMVSTHMAEIEKEIDELMKTEMSAKKEGLFSKKKQKNTMAEYVEKLDKSCFICEKIEASMERYLDTFFYLWKKEADFKEKVLSSKTKGFCVKHFEELVTLSSEKLSKTQREEFLKKLYGLQKENFKRVKEELLWFISKFDYRFKDEPWGNSKDSLSRAIVKTASYDVEKTL